MTGVPVPVLETGRLILRAHSQSDFGACLAMWSDPAVTRFIGGRPATAEETWARVLRYRGMWALCGFGYWAVTARGSGQFLGDVGFADLKRDMSPSFGGLPECGWALVPGAQGQGHATEAVQAACAWLDRAMPGTSSVCMISPENAPSLRVAAKCGFEAYARTTFREAPIQLFRRGV